MLPVTVPDPSESNPTGNTSEPGTESSAVFNQSLYVVVPAECVVSAKNVPLSTHVPAPPLLGADVATR